MSNTKKNNANNILNDIYDNQRHFLPGRRCARKDVVRNFNLPILIGGLNLEEATLILSTLPRSAESIYLYPLDKGLSGSKVFSAQYVTDKHKSKPFVFKMGPTKKIDQEGQAIERFVAPMIRGIGEPIIRIGNGLSLVVTDLVGLGNSSSIQSLRLYARRNSDADKVVNRLFQERLSNWYRVKERKNFHLGEIFKFYLRKGGVSFVYPRGWDDLRRWVKEVSGIKWENPNKLVVKLSNAVIDSPKTIIHGDLHSQNILVDDKGECWPIDFAWCQEGCSPIVDCIMLECSLKFLGFPTRANITTLIQVEEQLCKSYFPSIKIGSVPYKNEINNLTKAILAIRILANNHLNISFENYQKALFMMTYSLSSHPKLNRPHVLASLQILTGLLNIH